MQAASHKIKRAAALCSLSIAIALLVSCKTLPEQPKQGVVREQLATEQLVTLQGCVPTSKILPPSSVDPAALPVDFLKAVQITESVRGDESVAVITTSGLEGADVIFLQACRSKSIYCFDRLLLAPRTIEHRFEKGSDYDVELRSCVREDRAHVKNDTQKVLASETPGREYYCSPAHVLTYQHAAGASPAKVHLARQGHTQPEDELTQSLRLILSDIETYMNSGESPPGPLLAQLQNILLLRDNIYALAFSPYYDMAYATIHRHLAAGQATTSLIRSRAATADASPALRSLPTYCAYNEDITAVDHLIHHEDELAQFLTTASELPMLSEQLSARAAVYALLALGAIVSASAEEAHRELSFKELQDALFLSLGSLPTLYQETLPAFPLKPPSHPLLFGVGGRFVAIYDQALRAHFKSELGLDQERSLYAALYKDLEVHAADFHRLRLKFLDANRANRTAP